MLDFEGIIDSHPCFTSVFACFTLALLYVGSLYVWNNNGLGRDHPTVIKRRILSVTVVMIISPFITYTVLIDKELTKVPLWEVLGLRLEGLLVATLLPLLLTGILFLGPLCMVHWCKIVPFELDWVWLRSFVCAPLSEEWVFRACMMPLWVQNGCWNWETAVLMCPLWFGIAHAHHMWERIQNGLPWQHAVSLSIFQLGYTTLFGAYSALLFIKTGHIIAPVLAHSFCNMMGFPEVNELLSYKQPRKALLIALYILGFVLWYILLPSFTSTALYSNHLYSKMIH